MQRVEKSMNTALVQTLSDGRKRVTKKSLREKYGADKLAIVEQSIRHPTMLSKYRKEMGSKSRPLSHLEFADIENIDIPRFEKLLDEVQVIPSGPKDANRYHHAIEKVLSALFYPALTAPIKEAEIHDGRKRIDIRYTNTGSHGFFAWLYKHFTCPYLFVECKNYGKDIENPELDQLTGRFSPSRGKVGLLICRSIQKPAKIAASCLDVSHDDRGWIIVLTDEDIASIVKTFIESNGQMDFPLLKEKFEMLLMN